MWLGLVELVGADARMRDALHHVSNDVQVVLSGLRLLKEHCPADDDRVQPIIAAMEARASRLGEFHAQLSARVLPVKGVG